MNEAWETYLKITVQLTRLIRCSWDGIWLTGHGGGGMHPPDMQKQLQWVWHILCTFSVPKVLWIQNGKSLLYQDQGFGKGCLIRWCSTNVQTYSIQGMKKCARILRWTRKSMEQATLVLCNVMIIKESPICYILMKKTQGGKKTRLCTGNMMLSKQYLNSMKRVHVASCQMCGKKHTWSVRYARSMFVLRVERVCLVCPVALISMMI